MSDRSDDLNDQSREEPPAAATVEAVAESFRRLASHAWQVASPEDTVLALLVITEAICWRFIDTHPRYRADVIAKLHALAANVETLTGPRH